MLTLSRYDDKLKSNLVERYGGPRFKRYCKTEVTVVPRQCSILKEFFDYFVKGKEPSEATGKYVVSAVESASGDDSYKKGLIARYDGNLVIVFLNVQGLDTCALKITHNKTEADIFVRFMTTCSEIAIDAFYAVALKLLKDKQRTRIIKGLPTEGVIYSSYPEVDEPISSGFIEYNNIVRARKISGVDTSVIISDSFDRGVSYAEIEAVLPRDIQARFLARKFNDYERSQIEALEPNCALQA